MASEPPGAVALVGWRESRESDGQGSSPRAKEKAKPKRLLSSNVPEPADAAEELDPEEKHSLDTLA